MRLSSPNDAGFPASQFFGAQRTSMPTGTAPSSSGLDFGTKHVVVTGLIIVAVAYFAWHYAATH